MASKEVNKQTLELLDNFLEKHDGTMITIVIKDKAGKHHMIFGHNVTPADLFESLHECLSNLKAGFSRYKNKKQ